MEEEDEEDGEEEEEEEHEKEEEEEEEEGEEEEEYLSVEAESYWLVPQSHEEVSSVHLVFQVGDHSVD